MFTTVVCVFVSFSMLLKRGSCEFYFASFDARNGLFYRSFYVYFVLTKLMTTIDRCFSAKTFAFTNNYLRKIKFTIFSVDLHFCKCVFSVRFQVLPTRNHDLKQHKLSGASEVLL